MQGNKVLIIFIPVFVLIVGYIVYSDYISKEETSTKQLQDDLFDVPLDQEDSLPKDRALIYKQKWEKQERLARKVESSENFFGEEVKKDPFESEPNDIDFEEEVNEPERPKQIVVYKEKPVVTEVESTQNPSTEKQVRRKAGFTSAEVNNAVSENEPISTNSVQISAVVQDEMLVRSGSNVLLRTTEDGIFEGVTIPKNTLVYGLVSFTQERVKIVVNSIDLGGMVLTPDLKAYDLDGNEGLLVQGGIGQEVKRDALNDAVTVTRSQLNVPILRSLPSSAGSKRVNDPAVPLPKGHKMILRL